MEKLNEKHVLSITIDVSYKVKENVPLSIFNIISLTYGNYIRKVRIEKIYNYLHNPEPIHIQ